MHSPFRTESDVFKGALIVVCGIAASVAVGALTDASWGGIAAGVFIGIAIGLTMRAGRGTLRDRIEPARSPGDGAHRILVLANQTVDGAQLIAELEGRKATHPRLEVLVVSPSLPASRLQLIASDTDAARHQAQDRLERSLAALERAHIAATGVRGDEDPVQAAADVLHGFPADEVIVSTLPPGVSRWIERDVVGALRERVRVPVAHVTAAAEGSGHGLGGRAA